MNQMWTKGIAVGLLLAIAGCAMIGLFLAPTYAPQSIHRASRQTRHLFMLVIDEDGDIAQIERILKSDPSLANLVMGGEEQTLLFYAIKYGRRHDVMKLLLDMGADPNLRGKNSTDSPLCHAVLSEDAVAVKMLLDHGANPYKAKCIMFGDMVSGFVDVIKDPEIARMLSEANARHAGTPSQ